MSPNISTKHKTEKNVGPFELLFEYLWLLMLTSVFNIVNDYAVCQGLNAPANT